MAASRVPGPVRWRAPPRSRPARWRAPPRSRPFAFLGASLLAGVVVGRVTRSLAAEAKDEHDAQQAGGPVEVGGIAGPDYETSTAPTGYVAPGYAGAGYADTGYADAGLGTT